MRFISLATVRINVFGFELAMSVRELCDTRHVSATGESGKFSETFLKIKSFVFLVNAQKNRVLVK